MLVFAYLSSGASNSIVSSIICFCFCFFVFCSRLALVLYVVCRCCNKVSLKKKKKKLRSVGGMENTFCSYQLKTNLKNNSDCLFGPTIGQWHKYPSNGPSASYPGASGQL